jgi:hypothetical protein
MNHFDEKIIQSFETQIFLNSGFTEKQANLAIKILNRQKTKLESVLGTNIDSFLANPSFRLKRRTYIDSKIMQIHEHDRYQKAIHLTFPYNETIIQKIRGNKSKTPLAYWEPEKKSWVFPLNEGSLIFLRELSEEFSFPVPEELDNLFSQIKEVENFIENFVPLVSIKDEKIVFQNFSKFTPTIETNDVIEALFFARKVGINTWDDNVDKILVEKFDQYPIKEFLNTDPLQSFDFYVENRSVTDIKDIVKNLLPSIFIIPGGSELKKLKEGLDLLEKIGIASSEISVMFRLPKETGDEFNKFVKDSGLNNPISDSTKAIFISSKIPKPVIESNIKFNSIVNFNYYSVHYTIREFLKNYQNVINVYDKNPQRSINFAAL